MPDIKELLNKYGTSLEDTREFMKQFKQTFREVPSPPELPQEPLGEGVYSYQEVKDIFGVDLPDETYSLRVKLDDTSERGFRYSFITPDQYEIWDNNTVTSPTGQTLSLDEYERIMEPTRSPEYYLDIAHWAGKAQQETQQGMSNREATARLKAERELKQLIGQVYPFDEFKKDTEDVLRWLAESSENQEQFLQDIFKAGRTPEADALLINLFPILGADPKLLEDFWVLQPEQVITDKTEFDKWYFQQKGWSLELPGLFDPDRDAKLKEFQAHLDESFEAFQKQFGDEAGFKTRVLLPLFQLPGIKQTVEALYKYVDQPFITETAKAQAEWGERLGINSARDSQFLRDMQALYEKYGSFSALFSDEMGQLVEEYIRNSPGYVKYPLEVARWLNPVYMISLGGVVGGVTAKLAGMMRIPILGKSMETIAGTIQAIEKGLAYPISKPTELLTQGLTRAGEKISVKMTEDLIRKSKNLITIDALPKDVKAFERLIQDSLVDNWQKRALQNLARVPAFKTAINNTIGYRMLVNKMAQDVEHVVGRSAVGHIEMTTMGKNLATAKFMELSAVEMNPKRLFGFNDQGFSKTMQDRLLPAYSREKDIAGTLEHVFTNPEKYNFEGLGKKIRYTGSDGNVHEDWSSLVYVAKVHEINTLITEMLQSVGVLPQEVVENWIHRVVQEVKSKGRVANRQSKSIGAEPSFLKDRRFETMADGIRWFAEHPEVGYQYSANIEKSVQEYIQQAFRTIADKLVADYLSNFGVKPIERLLATRRDLFTEVVVKKGKTPAKNLIEYNGKYYRPKHDVLNQQVQKAKKFQDLIDQAIKGREIFSPKTISSMERMFPEIGQRFRQLIKETGQERKQLDKYLQWAHEAVEKMKALDLKNSQEIRALKEKLQASVKPEPVKETPVQKPARYQDIPTDVKLEEAFKVMSYEDRMAFKEALDRRMQDAAEAAEAQAQELWSLEEMLRADPIANVTMTSGTRKNKLIDWIRWKYGDVGELPESFTKSEAISIKAVFNPARYTRGYQWPQHMLNKKGRVRAEYIWDEWQEHFHMDYDRLREHINNLFEQKIRLDDLKSLQRMAQDTFDEYKHIYDLLEKVSAEADRIIPIDEAEFIQTDIVQAQAVEEVTQAVKPEVPDKPLIEIPKAAPGEPEAGLQADIFGGVTEVRPKGKGEVTQISMEDALKLEKLRKEQGLPDLTVEIKPQIEGIPELAGETQMRLPGAPEFPSPMNKAKRLKELKNLKNEISAKLLLLKGEQRLYQKAFTKAKERVVELGEGYLPQPFANGKIYSKDFIDQFNSFYGIDKGNGVLKVTADVSGIMRMLKASLDMSVMLAQGLPSFALAHAYLVTNPRIGVKLMGNWYKAMGYQIASFISPEVMMKYIAKNRADIDRIVSLGGQIRTVDYFDALSQQYGISAFVNKGLDKLPFKPYKRAEMAFFAGGQVVRTEFFKALYPMAVRHGNERELVRFLDRLTGIFDSVAAGVPLTVRQLEQSAGWFAPNYTRACMTLCAEIFRGGYTGDMARKALLGLAGTGSTYFFTLNYAVALLEGKNHDQALEQAMNSFGVSTDSITGAVTWKPGRNFMSLKVGDTYYGVGGFWTGLTRLASDISQAVAEDPEFGESKLDLLSLFKNRTINKDNPFIYFWYSRSAPFISTLEEIWANETFMGYPISTDEKGRPTDWGWENPVQFGKYIATKITPMWANDFIIPSQDQSEVTPAGAALSFFGSNVKYPTLYEKFNALADEYILRQPEDFFNPQQVEAWRKGRLHYFQLSPQQQTELNWMYPDLGDAYAAFVADRQMRNGDSATQYKQRMDVERKAYIDRLQEYVQSLQEGLMDIKTWRQKVSDAGSNYSYLLDSMEREPAYAEYLEYMNSLPDKNKYGYADMQALAEYETQIAYAEDLYNPATDTMDWKERDRRIDAFIEKWGENVYQGIQKYINDKKYQQGFPELFIRKRQDSDILSREYWRLPYRPYAEMDEQDIQEGNMPEDMVALWQQYRALTTEQEKQEFLLANPDFGKDFREEYRLANPEIDATLTFWGYGGKLQSMEAYDILMQMCQQYGLSMDDMKLGLPPRSIMPDYFEYNRLVKEFSPNSSEAKLFRLEHPEWNQWAVEDGQFTDDGSEWNEAVLRINVQWRQQDAEYGALTTREEREAYLESNKEYAKARYEREGRTLGLEEDMVSAWVEYSLLPDRGDWKNRYRLENPRFEWAVKEAQRAMGQNVWIDLDPSKVKPIQYDQIYDQYEDIYKQLEEINRSGGTEEDRKAKRQAIYEANPEFVKADLRREAYGLLMPDEYIENYVEYYQLPVSGYAQERYLKEHQDFYKILKEKRDWQKEIDFETIPTAEVEQLLAIYDQLPVTGKQRQAFRKEHPDLDEYLVKVRGLKPLGHVHKKTTETEFIEDFVTRETFVDWFKNLFK